MTASSQQARSRGGRHVVGRVSDLPEGERMIVDVDGRQVGVFHLDGEFFAFLHRCPHMAGPLCDGAIIGLVESDGPGDVRLDESRKFLTCPLHGWEFDVHTGQSYFDPARVRARRFPVEVRSGAEVAAEAGTPEAVAASGATAAPESDGRVPGPFTAETFDVSVEQDYIVVTTGRPRR